MTPEQRAIFGYSPRMQSGAFGPVLYEINRDGRRTVLAVYALGHFRDTLRSIHAEADACYRMWPDTRMVYVVGGEFDGYHMPRALWMDKGKRR